MHPHSLFMAPMTTWSGNPDRTVSDAELGYLKARAKNVDYVITACTFLDPNRQSFPNQFFAGSDEFLDSLTSLAGAIHAGGAQAILQVQDPGRMVNPALQAAGTSELVSASDVRPERPGHGTPRPMTTAEIDELVQAHHDVTLRAIRAGFDGLEIHGANTYLLQQFVSPLTNLRTDEYGQDRLLFVRRIVEAMEAARTEAGRPDFIIGYRFSPEEREDGGLRLEHTFELLDYLCSTDIDYLHASLEAFDRTSYFDDSLVIATALLQHIAGRKPLIGVGKIRTREDLEAAFALGFDHAAIGTGLLLNPDWAEVASPITRIEAETLPADLPPAMQDILLNVFAKLQ